MKNDVLHTELAALGVSQEVHALVDDLGLVPLGSSEHKQNLAFLKKSRYSRYLFCDRYKDYLKQSFMCRNILSREMYRTFRKFSRYSTGSIESCVQGRLL